MFPQLYVRKTLCFSSSKFQCFHVPAALCYSTFPNCIVPKISVPQAPCSPITSNNNNNNKQTNKQTNKQNTQI